MLEANGPDYGVAILGLLLIVVAAALLVLAGRKRRRRQALKVEVLRRAGQSGALSSPGSPAGDGATSTASRRLSAVSVYTTEVSYTPVTTAPLRSTANREPQPDVNGQGHSRSPQRTLEVDQSLLRRADQRTEDPSAVDQAVEVVDESDPPTSQVPDTRVQKPVLAMVALAGVMIVLEVILGGLGRRKARSQRSGAG